MDRDELLRLYDSGDFYGLLMLVLRAYGDRNHPTWRCASAIIDIGPAVPHVVLVTLPSALPVSTGGSPPA